MNVALMISRRLKASGDGRGPSRSSFIVAVCGVALALTVMMLSIAVVTGFKEAIRDKVAGYEPPLLLIPAEAQYEDGEPVELDFSRDSITVETVVKAMTGEGRPIAFSSVIDRPAVLKTDNDFLGVVLRSYGSGHDYSFQNRNLIEGKLPVENNEIALSLTQAQLLELGLGDTVFAHFISSSGVKTRKYTVSGIYAGNFGEYDKTMAFATEGSLSGVSGVGTDCLEVRGLTNEQADEVAPGMQEILNSLFRTGQTSRPWVVQTINQRGAMYYNWLELLDTNVVVILILMGCVCGLALISSLIILILERVRMTGILKSIGATDAQVTSIFLWLGVKIVGIGLIVGNAVALSLIFVQHRWHIVPLDSESYYLDSVPVDISLTEMAALNCGILVLALLLMLIPSVIVRRISPASVMRYE